MSEVSPQEKALIRMMTVERVHPLAVRRHDLGKLKSWSFGSCRLALESLVSCVLRQGSLLHDEALECLASLGDKRLLQAVVLYEAQYSKSRQGAVHLLLDDLDIQPTMLALGVWTGIRKGKYYTWPEIVKSCQVDNWAAMPPENEPYLFDSCRRVAENPLPDEVTGVIQRLVDGLPPDPDTCPTLRDLIVRETRLPKIMNIVAAAFPGFVGQVVNVLTSEERPWPKEVPDDDGMRWLFDLAGVAGCHLAETNDPAHWANLLAEAEDLPWLWPIVVRLETVAGLAETNLARLIHGWMHWRGSNQPWEKKGYPALPEETVAMLCESSVIDEALDKIKLVGAVPLLKSLTTEEYTCYHDFWEGGKKNAESISRLMLRDPEFFRRELRSTVRRGKVDGEFVLLWYRATGRDEQTPEDLATWVANRNVHERIPDEFLAVLLGEGVAGTDLVDGDFFLPTCSPDSLLKRGYELKPLDVSAEERVRRLIPHHRHEQDNIAYPSPIWDNDRWRKAILQSGFCPNLAVASILLQAVNRSVKGRGWMPGEQRNQAIKWLKQTLIPECSVSEGLQNALWGFAWDLFQPDVSGDLARLYQDAGKVARHLLARQHRAAWVQSANREVVCSYLSKRWWSMLWGEAEVVRAFLSPEDQVSLLLDNALKEKGREELPSLDHFEWLFTTPESKERLEKWLLASSGRVKPGSWLCWVRTHNLVESPQIRRRVERLLDDKDPKIQELAVAVLEGIPEENESDEEEE